MPEGPVVLMSATLRGMGQQVECDVLVRKLARNQPNAVSVIVAPKYSECTILSAPVELPDGEYIVPFEGHFVAATKEHGAWLFSQ